jgi:hypothetical protein
MNNHYLDFLDTLKEKRSENFMARTKSEVNIKTNIDQVVRDLSWVDMIEESIPYLDNIVRNPRRFIVQEEDLIPIEKTKKITEESIKHLARNTSLIQDIDKDGMVQPLKLLNVYKEETIDLYENRFIYSLLTNLKIFLDEQLKRDEEAIKSKYERIVTYRGETKMPGELVKINMTLSTDFLESHDELRKQAIIKERITNITEVISDFLGTQFIRSLSGATPVRSPIRKTNVILKDQNFIKAVELWEFLEKYNIGETYKKISTSKTEDPGNMIDKYNLTYYLDYFAVSNISAKEKELVQDREKYLIPYLRKVIETYVSEADTNDRGFKNMINNEFKRARKKQLDVYKNIRADYRKTIINHRYRVKNALSYLN